MVEKNREVIRANSKRFRYTLQALFVGICYHSLAGYYFLGCLQGWIEILVGTIFTVCVVVVVLYIHGEHYLVLEHDSTSRTDSESGSSAEGEPSGVEENDDGWASAKTVANSKGGSTSNE